MGFFFGAKFREIVVCRSYNIIISTQGIQSQFHRNLFLQINIRDFEITIIVVVDLIVVGVGCK